MLAFVLEKEIGLTKGKARSVASYFADTREFLDTEASKLRTLTSIGGKQTLRFSEDELEGLRRLQKSGLLDPDKPVVDNYLAAIGRGFTSRQLRTIAGLSLAQLSPNPFLIESLNLRTPEELLRLNVYMVITRSIVTSMGFLVEKLMVSSSDTVEKAPRGSGWDVVKVKSGQRHWIQAKSGPNDMDKDQVVYWAEKIEQKLEEGDLAFIGITYGKRENKTITLNLLKQLVPDWEVRTLIGRELWDFISDDPQYHSRLFAILRQAALHVFNGRTLAQEIEKCIERIEKEFSDRYGQGPEAIDTYVNDVF